MMVAWAFKASNVSDAALVYDFGVFISYFDYYFHVGITVFSSHNENIAIALDVDKWP